MAKSDYNIITMLAELIIKTSDFIVYKLIYPNSKTRIIRTIFKRADLCVETKEDISPSKEYPTYLNFKDGKYYYKLPIGMTFEKIDKAKSIFESCFKPQKIEIVEEKENSKAHFSIKFLS